MQRAAVVALTTGDKIVDASLAAQRKDPRSWIQELTMESFRCVAITGSVSRGVVNKRSLVCPLVDLVALPGAGRTQKRILVAAFESGVKVAAHTRICLQKDYGSSFDFMMMSYCRVAFRRCSLRNR
jgi:hypothetical protein